MDSTTVARSPSGALILPADIEPHGGTADTVSDGDASAFAAARAAGGDNAAIIHALTGHTHSESSIAMLVAAYRGVGDPRNAMRMMHFYLTRYPRGAYKDEYIRFLARNEPTPRR